MMKIPMERQQKSQNNILFAIPDRIVPIDLVETEGKTIMSANHKSLPLRWFYKLLCGAMQDMNSGGGI